MDKEQAAVEEETAQAHSPGKKRRPYFALFLLLWVLLLCALFSFALLRLHRFLSVYEESISENLVPGVLQRIGTGDTAGLAVTLADGSLPDEAPFHTLFVVQDYLRERLSGRALSYRRDPAASGECFLLTADEAPFARLTLREEKNALDFGLSAYTPFALQLLDEACLPYGIEVRVKEGDSVTIDGHVLTKEHLTGEPERITLLDTLIAEHLAEEPAPIVTYRIEGIFLSPDIAVRDASGKEVPCSLPPETDSERERFARHADVLIDAVSYAAPQELAAQLAPQVEGMLEPWGLFFSRDGSYHDIQRYFLPGSPVDRYLPRVDVSWMQYHNRVSFQDKRVTNYRLYTENCLACDVHFSQIIGVGDNPEVRRWDSDMTWFFVRREGSDTWLLADMLTLTGEG